MRSLTRVVVAWVLTAGVAAACKSAPAAAPAVQALSAPVDPVELVEERHELAIGDVVSVKFPNRAALNEEVVLRTDGRITLPLVGTVRAGGLTPEELEADLRRRYAQLAYEPAAPPGEKHYLLNVNDIVEIRFRNVPELNATEQIRPDGRISLQMVKAVIAEGKTPEQLEAELIGRYSQYLQNADLVVVVKQYTSELVSVNGRLTRLGVRDVDDPVVMVRSYSPRQVYIAGEVRAPGFVAYRPGLTALQGIIGAGGLLNTAAGDRIVLLRKSGVSAPTAAFLDLKSDLQGQTSHDVPLRAFDIVVVPKTKIASINQALDQYVYQLLPMTKNVNFTFFYDVGGPHIP